MKEPLVLQASNAYLAFRGPGSYQYMLFARAGFRRNAITQGLGVSREERLLGEAFEAVRTKVTAMGLPTEFMARPSTPSVRGFLSSASRPHRIFGADVGPASGRPWEPDPQISTEI